MLTAGAAIACDAMSAQHTHPPRTHLTAAIRLNGARDRHRLRRRASARTAVVDLPSVPMNLPVPAPSASAALRRRDEALGAFGAIRRLYHSRVSRSRAC